MGDGESLEEGRDRDKRDVALVYTRKHTDGHSDVSDSILGRNCLKE
jgi:hypothetical protein